MNSLRPSISKAMKQAMSRSRPLSTAHVYKPKTIDFTNMERKTWNIKRDWFSDPSTYPIFVIMGAALTFMTGAAANALIRYKDVTIDPKKRNSILQTWGSEEECGEYHSMLEKAISWNAYPPEGLGVDHDAWLKEKESAKQRS
eukprot:22166_1